MSEQDAPLLSFVRDGHEQKLLQWKNEREQSERWKRLDQSRQSGNDEVGATEGALQASNESEKIEVDALSKVNCVGYVLRFTAELQWVLCTVQHRHNNLMITARKRFTLSF